MMIMAVAIIGYGRMGRAVESLAHTQGIGIASVIHPSHADARYRSITEESLRNADVAIDFTSPGSVVGNIRTLAALRRNIVVGTTGWYDQLPDVRAAVESSGIGLVYGPNFSIGANVFFEVVRRASSLMNRFQSYDPFVYEMHHNQKTDAPGGTARMLGEIVVGNINRKSRLAIDRISGRRIEPDELHVGSIRVGHMPGTHVVGFDSESDTIELRHTVRSRAGFAEGALFAASWVLGRSGVYTFGEAVSEASGDRQ